MEGGDETAASGSSATGALARLEEARAAKQELAAAQRAWTQEVGALVNEQEAAIDALLSELETCRSQLAMQREAMAAMEARAGDGVAAVAALNTTVVALRDEVSRGEAAAAQLRADLDDARVMAERDAADKAFLTKSIGGLEHTQRQLTALLQAANERTLHAEEGLRTAVERSREAEAQTNLLAQRITEASAERDFALQRADAAVGRLSAAEQAASAAEALRRAAADEAAALREQADDAAAEMGELRQAARAASQAGARWETECSAAQASARGLAARLQETAASLDKEREARHSEAGRAAAAERDLAALRAQLREAGDALASMTHESEHLEGAAGAAGARAAAAESRAAAAEVAATDLRRRIAAAEEAVLAARADAAAKSSELGSAVAARAVQEAAHARLRDHADELTRQLASHAAQLEELRAQLTSARGLADADAQRWRARLTAAEADATASVAALNEQLSHARADAARAREGAERMRERAEENALAAATELGREKARAGSLAASLEVARAERDAARASAASVDASVGELRRQLAHFRAQLAEADAQSAAGLAATSGALQTAEESRADLLQRLEAATALALDIKHMRDAAVVELRAAVEGRNAWEKRCADALAELDAVRADASATAAVSRGRERDLRASLDVAQLAARTASAERDAALRAAAAARAELEEAEAERDAAEVDALQQQQRQLLLRVAASVATQSDLPLPDNGEAFEERDSGEAARLRQDLARESRTSTLLREELEGAWANVGAMGEKQLAAERASRAAIQEATEAAAESNAALHNEVTRLRSALVDAEATAARLRGRAEEAEKALCDAQAGAARAEVSHREALEAAQRRLADAWENVEALHARLTAATPVALRVAHAASQTLAPRTAHTAVNTDAASSDAAVVQELRRQLHDAEARERAAREAQRHLDSAEAEAVQSLRAALATAAADMEGVEAEYQRGVAALKETLTAQADAHAETEALLSARVSGLAEEVCSLRAVVARENAGAATLRGQLERVEREAARLAAACADAEAQLGDSQHALSASEHNAEQLRVRAGELEGEVSRLRSDLAVMEAITVAQREEMTRDAAQTALVAQHVASLEDGIAASAMRRSTLRDASSSAVPLTRDMGCSASPRTRDASSLTVSAAQPVHIGVQVEAIAEDAAVFSARGAAQGLGVAAQPAGLQHRPGQLHTATENGPVEASAPESTDLTDLSIGLGASLVDDDVERLRRRVAAQAKALTASRAREMERDARIADLSRATLRQQALLEALWGHDGAPLVQAADAVRQVARPQPAAGVGGDVMSVPLASSIMAHLVSAMLATPNGPGQGRTRSGAASFSSPEAPQPQARTEEPATGTLPGLSLASPTVEDPGLLVRSGVGGVDGGAQTRPSAPVFAGPGASVAAALQEARAATELDREARQAMRDMVSELREQISRIAPKAAAQSASSPPIPVVRLQSDATSGPSGDAQWLLSREEGSARAGAPLAAGVTPTASPHEVVVSTSRRQRSRRSTVRRSVGGSVGAASGAAAPGATELAAAAETEETVSARGIVPATLTSSTRADARSRAVDGKQTPSAPLPSATASLEGLPQEQQQQQLSFVDAFGQTITLLARCEFKPSAASSPPPHSELSSPAAGRNGRNSSTNPEPHAATPAPLERFSGVLSPSLLQQGALKEPQAAQHPGASAASVRAASLDALIRQHKAAFDTLLLTRKLSSSGVTTPSVRLRPGLGRAANEGFTRDPGVGGGAWPRLSHQASSPPPPPLAAPALSASHGKSAPTPPGMRLRDLDPTGAT